MKERVKVVGEMGRDSEGGDVDREWGYTCYGLRKKVVEGRC